MAAEETWEEMWRAGPERPVLGKGVHVWRIRLDTLDLEESRRILGPDEHERFARFFRQRDGASFAVCRAALRKILARYLDRDPAELRFTYNAYGKPDLAPEFSEAIHFNLSHSAGLALCVVARDPEVGIDVETLSRERSAGSIAKRFFSAHEVAALMALEPGQRTAGFFNCWTRKEAYVKARGLGLSFSLDRFDVSLAPGQPARLIADREEPDAPAAWFLHALDPGPGYAAALAIRGRPDHICCLDYPAS